MTNETRTQSYDEWQKTRSGAWASRGFHYQHLISTLVLVRQWTGLLPTGLVVPEGLDDCVLELADVYIRIQIKSRKNKPFTQAEVDKILLSMKENANKCGTEFNTRHVVVLEQPCADMDLAQLDQLCDDNENEIFICQAPEIEITELLTAKLNTSDIISEGIANDLYKMVADTSQANASVTYELRKHISTTDVERHIFERLEAEDPSSIDQALSSRDIEPIDFKTSIDEPSFYQGVKVKPGHVAAGLVLDRQQDTTQVIEALKNQRQVLISGPSGAGKSALMWLSANKLCSQMRWYQISDKSTETNADAIVRFIRSRRPSKRSPIGLILDDVDSTNSNLWNILTRELRGLTSVYCLGSVRQEDICLIANRADIEFVAVNLNEDLAQAVWQELSNSENTHWPHWREPYEQSEGLMLEFVHLLTEGKRLVEVIAEQIQQRVDQDRHDELAIIRSTSVLCAREGEVDTKILINALGLDEEEASKALSRLIDEHLVRETKPGILGGLHALRSEALAKASHDEVVYLVSDSLWKNLLATTDGTLPRVIHSVIAKTQKDEESQALTDLAQLLSSCEDINVWTAVFTGLGLASLDRQVELFINILKQYDVPAAQWSLASMFYDPATDVNTLSGLMSQRGFIDAVLAFRSSSKPDLRKDCLSLLPDNCAIPECSEVKQCNRLLSSLAPIGGAEPIKISITPDFRGNGEYDIHQVAELLHTAYLIDVSLAKNLVQALGGEQELLNWFYNQTPWTTRPIIDTSGIHGRTVRANLFFITEEYQTGPHSTICDICSTLIALSPDSDAASSDVISPTGEAIKVGDHVSWSKNMPRHNIPPKAKIAWNVAFRQILLSRVSMITLTDYAQQMSQLIKRTDKAFMIYTEKWIKSKIGGNANALFGEMDDIIETTNTLAYADPAIPESSMDKPAERSGTDDTLGALLTGILGNLVKRLNNFRSHNVKAMAIYADNLADQAQEHQTSDIWRVIDNPPSKELKKLSKRLSDTACILHEFAHNSSQDILNHVSRIAKKATIGNGITNAALHCRKRSDQRFERNLHQLKDELKKHDIIVNIYTQPDSKTDNPYWPAQEITVLYEMQDFETDGHKLEKTLKVAKQILRDDWLYSSAPIMNGFVLSQLAMLLTPISNTLLPFSEFTQKWENIIDLPVFRSEITDSFNRAIDACIQISGVAGCIDFKCIRDQEDDTFGKLRDAFMADYGMIKKASIEINAQHLNEAVGYLEEIWDKFAHEHDAAKNDNAAPNTIYLSINNAQSGQEDTFTTESANARLFILQEECLRQYRSKV